jgi:hypothetical protein
MHLRVKGLKVDELQPHELLHLEEDILAAVEEGDRQTKELEKVVNYLQHCTSIPSKQVPGGF